MSEWISVEERMPKSNVRVLVHATYGIFVVAVWDNRGRRWRATWNHGAIRPGYVTHWQPLPSPPGEEVDSNASDK